ncbi:acetoacetate--CoA ligase [Chryseolinea sp. T2]|uniref:acetoacetate--CoA ligase n=1 Tax=Chryseolinea sp. T2 TaxID=3129255 RepID=UPI003078829B
MSSSKLWTPAQEVVEGANITAFCTWLGKHSGRTFSSYHELWQWSIDHSEVFWSLLMKFFNVTYDGVAEPVTNGMAMPDTRWFEGVSLSYAEHIFRNETSDTAAIIATDESGESREISWQQLRKDVASFQEHLRRSGVTTGDRIVAFLPNIPEATISFLAANGLGCVWSSCSPDFGVAAVVERFGQIKPKILIACTEYNYGGKTFNTTDVVEELCASLPSVEQVILVSAGDNHTPPGQSPITKHLWPETVGIDGAVLECRRVSFNHPIWVLYSSGTTGKPKAIVHGTGGILLEHLKYGAFHNDFKRGERCFWFTTTGWMMWNYIHGSLLSGCTLVLYDGSPGHPDLSALWQLADRERIAHFGVSAAFIMSCLRRHAEPNRQFNFASLRSIGSTGSTLPAEGFNWIYDHVKKGVWLSSMSGGTDVCSAFVGGNPTLPVYAGEIQCRALGCSLFAYDDNGKAVNESVGEMVITRPMPSMPIFFWNDPDGKRYHESYFETFPGVWRHGDWIRITEHDGIVIYGRSDATLNRGGVRIGTSEIYSAVDLIPEVRDSLIVCIEKEGGQFWMPLFVVMQPGMELTDQIKKRINQSLKENFSPRHVPDEIVEVPDIPFTISGKKTETPVKKILMGANPSKALNRDVLRNPQSLDFFIALAAGM